MGKMLIKFIVVFMVFFTGTGSIIMLDNVCQETTGEG